MPAHRAFTSSRLLVVAAAVLFSTGGAGLKADAFSTAEVSGLRSSIAALAVLLWLGRRITFSRSTAVAGVAYAVTVSLFVMATRLTTAANAIFLQSAAPLYIVAFSRLVPGERFQPRDLWFLAAAGAGLLCCFLGTPDASRTAPDPAAGNLLAVLCSLTWATTLVLLRQLERRGASSSDGLSAVAIGNLLAALMAAPVAGALPDAPLRAWAVMAYLGVFQIGLAYWCLTRAVRALPALEVSLLLLIEPVLNPLWTWLIRGEAPGRLVIAGGAVILVATALRSMITHPRAA